MVPDVLAALRQVVDEVGADAGVLVRLAPSGSAIVTTSTLAPVVTVGDTWGEAGALSGTEGRPELTVEPDRLRALVPQAARTSLPAELSAALVAPVADTPSRLVLLWAHSPLPHDVLGALESGSLGRLPLLTRLLDPQVRAQEDAGQLGAVVAALDQAVVLTPTGSGLASVNVAAARLLGLQPGGVDPTVLSDAMRALLDRVTDPVGLTAEADRLLASPTAVVRDWLWTLPGIPSHLRVTILPADAVTEGGRIWVFDDISAEMGLVESERRAVVALAQSEQRYRMLAENVADVVVQGTAEGTITWVSPSVESTMGWSPSELVGRSFSDLVHPQDLGDVVAEQERLRRGERAAFEVRLRTARGDHRWMSIRAKPVLDDDGRIVEQVAGWWDAQASREAMERLALSEGRYHLLLENTTEVVFQTIEGLLTWVSPALEPVTGWRPQTLLGTTTDALWHPDDLAKAVALRDNANRGAHGREVLRLRDPDGQFIWMEVVMRPYVERDGRAGTVGTMCDVTDRVLAHEAAQASEERYRTVAENAGEVVCRYRADGVIDWAFGSTEALAGCSAQDLVGTAGLSMFMTEDLVDLDRVRARLARGEVVQQLARLRRADGSTCWIALRGRAVIAADGSIEYIIGTWRDAQGEVEYRDALEAAGRHARDLAQAYKVARNEAIEASAAKTAFLSRMSHELRTPLNAVLGFAQLLALDPLTTDQAEAVRHIRSGGRHLLDLINEIVDISRIEGGRLSLSMEKVDAADVLRKAVDMVRALAQQHNVVVIAADADAPVADVHADRQRVTQVLVNLMSNAVKYNRPGGSVRVGCRSGSSGDVAFEVTDTGPGIAEELLPRLFVPFDRLGAENSEVEGTGIGLALADALARAMGGRIEVTTQVGVGSTFTLVLRAAAVEPDRTVAADRKTDLNRSVDLRILYVEDNPTNAVLMHRVVALRPGCRLRVAADGALGIAAALREPPDLVFLDLHLPDMPGAEVLRRVRALPGCADIPIVVVTADASPGAHEQMRGMGSDGFLTKPLDLEDVLGWIDGTPSGRGRR